MGFGRAPSPPPLSRGERGDPSLPPSPPGRGAGGEGPQGRDASLLRLAIRALSRREHSRLELERRLVRESGPGADLAQIATILDRLRDEGLQSDLRMAQSFVRARAGRMGGRRLRSELQRRGLDEAVISGALPDPSDDARALLELWRRRFPSPATDARGRSREARFLAARGFSHDLIHRLVLRGGGLPFDTSDEASADASADASSEFSTNSP